jgi:hypothetical protein
MLSRITSIQALRLTFNGLRRFAGKNKIVRSADEALDGLKDGDTILAGGFGL